MQGSGTFTIAQDTKARYYVVWLTQLTGSDGGYQGSVSEVGFRAQPS
jgi:hypothetical protein